MASRNISVSEASRTVLPRHARLKFDETRKVWVILAPERVLAPDEIAVEVLQLCDGERRVLRRRKFAPHFGGRVFDIHYDLREKCAGSAPKGAQRDNAGQERAGGGARPVGPWRR